MQVLTETDTRVIYQVMVSEGRARGIYLLGLETRGEQLISDLLLVATDGAAYHHCQLWTLPAMAVSMVIRTVPEFSAILDVEPSNLIDDLEELRPREDATACRRQTEVTWQAGVRFDLRSDKRDCPMQTEAPRRIRIDDSGAIQLTH